MAQRRTTLGPMSTADITRTLSNSLDDSRASMGFSGPARSSFGVGRGHAEKPRQRESTIQTPGTDRRHSITSKFAAIAGGGGAKADPRSITSKQFQNDTIQAIVEYCQASNYRAGPINAKILGNPTGKDFSNVIGHLCQQIDFRFSLAGRIEDEVQTIFKVLRYPFTLSKTSLTAVGSPTTYPAILAAMGWLVELLSYDAAVDSDPLLGAAGAAADDDTGAFASAAAGESSFFFAAVKECYAHFLAGDDAAVDAVDARVAGAFGVRHSAIQADAERLRAANAALSADLEAVRGTQSALPALRTARAHAAAECEVLRAQLAREEGARDALCGKLGEHQAALAAKEEEHDKLLAALGRLQGVVATQELSAADVDRLCARKTALREEHASLQAETHAAQRAVAEAEAGVKRACAEVAGRVAEYSSQAARLQLLPQGAKYSFGVDFALRFNEAYLRDEVGRGGAGGADASFTGSFDGGASRGGPASTAASASTTAALLCNDIKHTIKPQLRELKAKMARQAGEHGRAILELADGVAALEEATAEHRRAAEAHGRALRAREEVSATLRGETEASLGSAQGTTEALSAQVGAARTELAAAAAATVREESLRNEQLKLNTFAAFLAHKRAEAKVTIEDAVQSLALHKDAVEAKLQGLRARVQAQRDAELAAPAVQAPPRAPAPLAVAAAGGGALGSAARHQRVAATTPGGSLIAALPAPTTASRAGASPASASASFGPAPAAWVPAPAAAAAPAPTAKGPAPAAASYVPPTASRRLGFEGL